MDCWEFGRKWLIFGGGLVVLGDFGVDDWCLMLH